MRKLYIFAMFMLAIMLVATGWAENLILTAATLVVHSAILSVGASAKVYVKLKDSRF